MNAKFFRAGGLCHAALAGVAVLLSACTAMDPRKDADFAQHAHGVNQPLNRPVRSLSGFSDSLACMDRLFYDAGVRPTLITSKLIPDATGRVSVATKDMVVTALSKMSNNSGAFRYVDYEIDIVRQDTVQNLTGLLLSANQVQLQRPALYVSGAISFVDQNVLSNNYNAGTSASRLETGYTRSKNATILGIDLHLGDFRSRTIIPGVESSNEVALADGGQGIDVAGRIGRYGVQFNMGRDYAQGTGGAVRTLVELALIELLGKWARLPYWQCLSLDQAHPDFQRQMRDWFDAQSFTEAEQLTDRALYLKGYLPEKQGSAISAQARRAAYNQFQLDHNIVPSGRLDFSTYERVLRDYVEVTPDGRFTRIGWGDDAQRRIALRQMKTPASAQPPSAATVAASPVDGRAVKELSETERDALRMDLRIANLMLNGSAFPSGEQIFLTANLSRAAYLYCFYQEANGGVSRIYPNKTHSTALVPAGRSIRLPDWLSPTPGFIIETNDAGVERIRCLASEADVADKLPPELLNAAFKPIPGVRDMSQVKTLFDAAAAGAATAGAQVEWTVTGQRATPAAAAGPTSATTPTPAPKK
jgi:Domain of unknown function (DUF4384)